MIYEDFCNECGASYTFTVWDSHNYSETIIDGKIYKICSQCEERVYIKDVEPPSETTGNSGGSTIDPDEPEDPDDPVDPSCSHTYVGVKYLATCEYQGCTIYTCSKCDDHYFDDFTPALGHLKESLIVPPTCTQDGYTDVHCTRAGCGEDWVENRVPALGHNLVNHVCTRCGYTDVCVHTYTETVYPPTCDSFGYTLFFCTKCSESYHDQYTNQLEHIWKLGSVTAATCDKNGYKEKTCLLCGEFDTEILDAFGHKWEVKSSVIASDNTANVVSRCTVCNETKTENIPTIAAQAQNWLLTSIRGFSQALIDMYETVANGVEVGGVTAGEVIAGSVILAAVLFLIAFALGNKG